MSNAVCETMTVGCAVGCAQSGRTAYLLRRAGLLAAGQGRVAYVCARSADVDRVRARLAQAGISDGAVEVTTARELALEVLATPQGLDMFGRKPRVLERYEQDILLEDLKVSQMRNRRLRQVLTYLFAGWENLSDESWEKTPEEDLVIARLRDNLRFYGGVLACEASNLALKAVSASEDVRRRCTRDHILVDDYELLSRASQHLVRALAGASLTVAGALRPGLAGDDEHPCYAGIDELVRAFPGTRIEMLGESCQSSQVKGVLEKLSADEALVPIVEAAPCGPDAACGSGVEAGEAAVADGSGDTLAPACASALRVEPSLERELQALAEASADALARGRDVMIVGADRLWRRNVAANLARVGLPVRKPAAPLPRLRDFRDERACARVRRDALDRLVRDPQDELAWRSMVALGDAVGRSAAVDRLRQWASRAGQPAMGLHDALEQLSAGNVEVDELTAPLLDDLREAYFNARGQLYARIGAQMASCGEEAAGEDGVGGGGDEGAPGILVCSPEQASGRRAGAVIFGGFVNGLIPCRAYFDPAGLAGNARIRERRQAALRVFGVASCARDEVLFTAFSSCSLQAAETMDVHIERIKLRRGLRVALTSPSIFADGLGG